MGYCLWLVQRFWTFRIKYEQSPFSRFLFLFFSLFLSCLKSSFPSLWFLLILKSNLLISKLFSAVLWKWKMKVKVAQLCLTLCDPMDYTVHGILQARILEWVAFPFSRGSSQSRDQTQVSHIAGRFFTSWATREALRIQQNFSLNVYKYFSKF